MHDIYKVGKEDMIIFHAAAGGVGSIASVGKVTWSDCHWHSWIGRKIDYAKSNGCDHVINISKESLKM